jgi:hypothetical protein
MNYRFRKKASTLFDIRKFLLAECPRSAPPEIHQTRDGRATADAVWSSHGGMCA